MKFYFISLFPSFFSSPFETSIIKRAIEHDKISCTYINPRDFALDRYKTCDDVPYGGGPGMIMKPEPLFLAVESITSTLSAQERLKTRIVSLSAKGELFTQKKACSFAENYERIILICGHYEGIDERVNEYLVEEELRVGDYVLTGGEIPALVVTDAITRLIPGVLGNKSSLHEESFSDGQTREYPQYTRPADFRGMKVPDVLLSGNHKAIQDWKMKKRKKRETIERHL